MDQASPAEHEEILAPDENPTPMWLPLLGAGLLVLAVILFLATQGKSESAAVPASDNVAAPTAGEQPVAPH